MSYTYKTSSDLKAVTVLNHTIRQDYVNIKAMENVYVYQMYIKMLNQASKMLIDASLKVNMYTPRVMHITTQCFEKVTYYLILVTASISNQLSTDVNYRPTRCL